MSDTTPNDEKATHRTLVIPTRTLGAGHISRRRAVGAQWSHVDGTVTVLLWPDHPDDGRALFTLTPEAAEALAQELRNCASWARNHAAKGKVVEADRG